MWILILCVIVNSLLVILFKVFSKYDINLFHAIVINYFVAFITAWLFLGDLPVPKDVWSLPWFPYAVVLGILFITFFNIIGISVQKSGLVITTIFQKMSLLAPAIMGIAVFHESGSLQKIIGIVLAVLAIIMVSYNKKTASTKLPKKHLYLALLVFFGSAMIDAILYWVDVEGVVGNDQIQFVTVPFLISGFIGVLVLLLQMTKNKTTISAKSAIAGVILGIPNFFSIYLILESLAVGIEGSVVFPVNNIGILLLAALIGIVLFKESINRYKIIGFSMAIIAILLISYG